MTAKRTKINLALAQTKAAFDACVCQRNRIWDNLTAQSKRFAIEYEQPTGWLQVLVAPTSFLAYLVRISFRIPKYDNRQAKKMFSFMKRTKKSDPFFVSQSVLDAENPFDLADEVAQLWGMYEQEDFVRPEDLPDGIFDVSCALYYYGRVLNGGHAQFLVNSEFSTSTYDSIERVLRESGNDPMLAIFTKFRRLVGASPSQDLFEDTGVLELLTELNHGIYALQKGAFDFYATTNKWIRNDLDVVVKSSEEVEQFRNSFASSLPGYRDYKLGAYLAPLMHGLSENDTGLFQAAVSGMRVEKKPVFIDRATEIPRPAGESAKAERFFSLQTSIGKMYGFQADGQYALCQRTGPDPNFETTLRHGTGSVSDIRKLLEHAQRHDPVLIAHLLLDADKALSGLKRIAFYFRCHAAPEPLQDTLSYLVIDQKGRSYRMDVSDLGSGLCDEGEFDTALASLQGSELKRKMKGLSKQLKVYESRKPS